MDVDLQPKTLSGSASKALRGLIKRVPLFGGLPDSRRSSIRSAAKEVGISTVFSTLPIWFFPSLYTLFFSESSGLWDNVSSSISQGDLYIYSSALIGPLMFAITFNYAEWGNEEASPNASRIGNLTFVFPYGTWFFFIAILIAMIAVFCFGIMRFETSGFIQASLNHESLLNVSIAIYLFSLLCLFLVSVYRNDLNSLSSVDGGETKQFVDQWNKRHG